MRFLHLTLQENVIRSCDYTKSVMLRRETSYNKCHAPEENSLTERDLTYLIRFAVLARKNSPIIKVDIR